MNVALLLVDIQNDYFPCGRMELSGSLEVSQKAGQVLSLFRERSLPLIHIQHIAARPDAPFFISGTAGVEIHENVNPLSGEPVIKKQFPNSFRETPLLEQLRSKKIDQLAIAGMMTHMCIDATTRAAFDHGFQCTVLHDACATRSLIFNDEIISARQVHAAFLAALSAAYAKVVSTDEFIASLG
jgi:nicotinamidase-related amidase